MTTLNRRMLLGAGLAAVAGSLGACNFQGGGDPNQNGDGDAAPSVLRISHGPHAIDSLDPHFVNNGKFVLLGGLLEGLVLMNEQSNDVVPGAAESWEVSDDNLTYTFHMRPGATWSNGDPVTAQDAEWTFQRLMSPTGASGSGMQGASTFNPGLGIRGAAEFNSGRIEDWAEVGITATDDETLTIELAEPNPGFLLALTDSSLALLHPASIEAEPQKWQEPENWVGNGAYVLESWDLNSLIVLVKNENYYDADNVAIDRIEQRLSGDLATNLVAFKSGELDITSSSVSLVEKDPEASEQAVYVDSWLTMYLQAMWGGHPAIQDQRVRQAFHVGIDRSVFEPAISSKGAVSIVPDVVEGWTEEAGLGFDMDRANELLSEAGLDKMPNIRIQFPGEDPALTLLAEQLKENFGNEVVLDVVESGVHTSTRWERFEDETMMSFYGGTAGGLPTFNTWVADLLGPEHQSQFSLSWEDWEEMRSIQQDEDLDVTEKATEVQNILDTRSSDGAKKYASLVQQARSTVDEAERQRLFIQAARERTLLAQTIPLIWKDRVYLVSDQVGGMTPHPVQFGYYYKDLTVNA